MSKRTDDLAVTTVCVFASLPPRVTRQGNETLSRDGAGSGSATRLVRRHYLYLQLDCDHPLRAPVRFALGGLDEVRIGRGDTDTPSADSGAERVLSLKFPDGRMSSRHARIARDGRAWQLEDLGSKNGSFVNGAAVSEPVELSDGDVVELGHTFFVFRSVLAPEREEATVVSAADVAAPARGLETLSVSLAGDFAAVAKVAPSMAPIVLLGESGVGKEVVARAVHEASGRTGKFVAVNCAALPPNLVEAELFGHKKGAFSGAVDDRPGLVRTADGGTLFLDEIGDLPEPTQAALLRVLQEHEVRPVGASEPVPVDFRLVAATNRDLSGMVAADRFRADLYARISAFTVALPPLRARAEDLGLIIGALLRRVAGPRAGDLTLSFEAGRALLMYGWPHNIRELENYLVAAVALAEDTGRIELEHFPLPVREVTMHAREAPVTDEALREQLVKLLTEHDGNVSAVARAMGKTRTQIHRFARRFDLDFETFRR